MEERFTKPVSTLTQVRRASNNALLSETVRFEDSWSVDRSFDPYAKRRKPKILKLSPTSQRRVGASARHGLVSYKTRPYKVGISPEQYVQMTADTLVDSQYGKLNLATFEKITNGLLSAFPTGSDSGYKTWANVERRQACETKLLIKLKRKYEGPEAPDGNLTETFAEADKTMIWLSDRVKSIAHILDGVKKGNWVQVRDGVRGAYKKRTLLSFDPRTGKMKRGTPRPTGFDKRPLPRYQPEGWSTRDAADRYLEVHFAVEPILNDAASVCVDFAKLVETQLNMLVDVSATDVVSESFTRALKPKYWPVGGGVGTGQMPVFNCSFRVRDVMKVTAVYVIEDEWRARLTQAGVSLGGLAQAAYARSPYSWLLDWGVGVGEYLEAVNADAGARFVAGYDVRRLDVTDFVFTHVSNGDAREVSVLQEPIFVLKSTERSVRTSAPRAYTQVKSPVSTSHALTAAALIRSLFPRN